MSIGSGTEGGISDVRFFDNSLDHMKAGIHIKSNPGRGGLVHNVVFDDICIRNTATPIDLETTYINANAPWEGVDPRRGLPDLSQYRAAQCPN